uniref:Uncharacterized protein n=1 Tax=Schistosoma mansoni TaxID=6183 RepID=A0A5K4FCX6_SCHMA
MSYRHASLDCQHELEDLRSNLATANSLIAELETKLSDLRMKYDTDCCKYEEKIQILTERHERLISSHQRLSKLNHELEERLLDTIEKSSTEIQQLTEELESTKHSLRTAQQTLNSIVEERDRCKEDCISAVKLLQENPNQFISELPPIESPPPDKIHILTNLSNGDCSHGAHNSPFSSSASIFSTFLPTFPPVGLFTGIQMENNLQVSQKSSSNNTYDRNINSLNKTTVVTSAVNCTSSCKSSGIIDL